MSYFLAPYIGKGTYQDPFRPEGSEQPGAKSIDLRPDGSKRDGFALMFLPEYLPYTHRKLERLGDYAVDTHGWTYRRKLRYKLGLAANDHKDVRALVQGLLVSPPSGSWKPLVGHEIHLGHEDSFHLRPIAGGATATETFNTADSDTLGPVLSWTELAGDWDVVGNQASSSGGSPPNVARANTDMSSVDHEVSARLTTVSPDQSWGVIARKDSTATMTYYGALIDTINFPPFHSWCTFKYIAGSFSVVDRQNLSGAGFYAVDDVLACACVGSSISLKRNAVALATTTDTDIPGGVRGGVWAWHNSLALTLDNFILDPVAGAGGVDQTLYSRRHYSMYHSPRR